MASCRHCGQDLIPGKEIGGQYCCAGCQAAHDLVEGLGLDQYYQRRSLDPAQRPLVPEEDDAARVDFTQHAKPGQKGDLVLYLMVEGLHCAACVWLIENVLARQPGVTHARLNMTTRRLELRWTDGAADPNLLARSVTQLGYRLVPYDPARIGDAVSAHEKELLKCMAVAGFAAGNVMLFSVSIWAGQADYMGWATRTFLHWLSALIALPAVVYSGRPFFKSAYEALSAKRTNMDVPISLGVLLATGMSLWETVRAGEHAYFDAAISLLFFLLIGRYLDSRARGRARSAASHLIALGARSVTVLLADGARTLLPPQQVATGSIVLVAPGERIGIDGKVSEGVSDLDASLISGETLPIQAKPGTPVFAGMLNLSAALRLEVTAAGEATLLAEIVRLMENAEQGRARYAAIADRVARWYAPVVHTAALGTFLFWTLILGTAWQPALMIAVSVLIITCPCALALAVPVVQVVASGRLMRQGILMKSATALERLAQVDHILFDKTGTLTLGRPELLPGDWTAADLALAASLAVSSRHPLARALARRCPEAAPMREVTELAGLGLEGDGVRLGRRAWCQVSDELEGGEGPELWLARTGRQPVRFAFEDSPRPDSKETVNALTKMKYSLELLSGDRAFAVESLANRLGVAKWRALCLPADKVARLEELKQAGHKPLMVGDGLNDAPALSAAFVSMSPSTAVDVSQTAADVIFQGDRLMSVAETLRVAKKSNMLVKQNFGLALAYNLVTVPLAMAGHVTPLIAAIAMSSSSVVVIVNALRLGRR
ncbi:MAG: heavy metal translocating P-type ATPase metal-binding domain-containing protein [Rhodospirillales bacterium]|nr:heavy metal translocating P-type ATPase metal-binding domain-containing protein [Rhodospirillales bacterium]